MIKSKISYAIKSLEGLSQLEKLVFFIWFSGPFLFLLGRTTADLWISLIAFFFLGKSLLEKDIKILKVPWLISIYILLVIFIISSIFSQNIFFSLGESLAWLRFPIFALAVQIMFMGNKKFTSIMLISILSAIFLVTSIGFIEFLIEPKPRLTWPFSKQIPGSFIAKVGMVGVIFLTNYALIKFKLLNLISLLFLLFIVAYVMLTGERMAFVILLVTIFITSLLSNKNRLKFILFFILISLPIIFLFSLGINNERYTTHTFNEIFNIESSGYWTVWFSGINAFLQNIWTGIGPGYLAESCELIPNIIGYKIGCENHPHNYYIQMLAEVGILGPIALIYLVFRLVIASRSNRNFYFLVPIILFFPVSTSGDFFGQFGNVFTWFSIGMALQMSGIDNFKENKV